MNQKYKAIFITVRTASTRLPQKALLPIQDKPTIVHLIEHIKKSRLAEKIVLCTTTHKEDKPLVDIAKQNGIFHFCGSEPDKLERWRGAAEAHGVDFFVTADGDDLMTDPELIDQAFQLYQKTHCDFIHAEGYPPGAFTYGIKVEALKKVCAIKDTEDTEMMWGYFLETGLFHIEKMTAPLALTRPQFRMTLDYPEDLAFFKAVIEGLSSQKKSLSLGEIVAFLDANPHIVQLNQFRHSEFLANQQKKKKVVLKIRP